MSCQEPESVRATHISDSKMRHFYRNLALIAKLILVQHLYRDAFCEIDLDIKALEEFSPFAALLPALLCLSSFLSPFDETLHRRELALAPLPR
jgi:hypothetical protein